MKILEEYNKGKEKQIPEIRTGDIIKVYQKVKEKNKERIQVFSGIVIARKHGRGLRGTITVRREKDGWGVERIFPLHSPTIERFEVVKHSKVRRAKLYFLRNRKGKKGRLKTLLLTKEEVAKAKKQAKVQKKGEKEKKAKKRETANQETKNKK